MSSTTTIIPVEQEEKKEQILHSQKFLTWLEDKIPNIGFAIAIGISLMICLSISKYELDELPEDDTFIKFIVVIFKVIFDLSFVFSSLVTAKFVHEKKKPYAIIFISITAFGFFYTIWRSVMYALSFEPTNVITPKNVEQDDSLSPITTSLIFVFGVATCLKVVFAEASAFMLYNSKTKRNTETGETRNSETATKQGENDVSQESEEETQGKIEELELPNKIEKIGENKFSVNGELPKDLKGFKGNARVHASKKNQAAEEGKYRKARISEVWENYYNAIIEIIEKEEVKGKTSWTVYPNGLLANDSEPKEEKINGHKLEPEFFK